MGSGVADCSSPDVMAECSLLMDSEVSFIPHSQDKKWQFTISNQLKLPLDLTLQSGRCKISCEGGLPENCTTTKRRYLKQKVMSPIYFENCSSDYNYCVIAQIGDCCPVCTETKYMEEYQPVAFSAPVSPWNVTLATFVILVIIAALGGIIIYVYTIVFGDKAPKSVRAGRIIHVPLQCQPLALEPVRADVTVLCLYVIEESPSFLSGIESLQAFLKEKGFNVVDIYVEEELINQSIYKWTQTYLKDCSTKIMLVDTESFRSLLDHEDVYMRKRPVEKAIIYIHSCIPLNNTFSQLFVVRFQETVLNKGRFLDLSNGRCYMYPINRERLAEDLQS